jgi:hypothetical protein
MTEQPQAPQLSLNDFSLVVNIIDACTERGAFKGNELATIGQLREKFVAFVKANTPPEEVQAADDENTSEEAQ